jgi:hypothetical protein
MSMEDDYISDLNDRALANPFPDRSLTNRNLLGLVKI